MINTLVITLFVVVFWIDYLVRDKGLLHPYLILLPEVISAAAMIVVLMRIIAGRRIDTDWRYVSFIGLLLFAMIFGFVVQDVSTGTIVAGMRAQLKFIPFFLLPMVYRFQPRELRTQLIVLLTLLALEVPLAVYQRFVEFAQMMQTGDPVKGTATTSSALSLMLLCGIAALIVLYLRNRLRLIVLIPAIGLLFLPTTINETKATLFLLPVAVLLPAFCMRRNRGALRKLVPVIATGAAAAIAFVTVYDTLIQKRQYGQPIGAYFTLEGIERYLYARGTGEDVDYIGRFDSIAIATEHVSRDPSRLMFGLGAGNVSPSFLPQFDGKYASYFDRYAVDMTQITSLIWQIGFVGLSLYVAFYLFQLRDAYVLSRSESEIAMLGQIWFVVMAIMTLALLYKSTFAMNEIGFPMWFYSGVVAAETARIRRASRERVPHVRDRRRPLAAERAISPVSGARTAPQS